MLYSVKIVAHLLKERSLEPEKQPLLANGSETIFVLDNGCETVNGTTLVASQQILNKQEYTAATRKRHGKDVPAATDTHATEERCFLRGPWPDVISMGQGCKSAQLLVNL
jgi:hypothetical protein